MVESLDQEGNSNLGLSASSMLSISAFTNSGIPSQKSLTVSGESGQLKLGGTLTFQNGSKFVLDSQGSRVSGDFDFVGENTFDVQKTVSFQSSSSKWKDSQIKVSEAAVLTFEDNQLQTQGTLTKTGGALSWDNVSWTLLETLAIQAIVQPK